MKWDFVPWEKGLISIGAIMYDVFVSLVCVGIRGFFAMSVRLTFSAFQLKRKTRPTMS